MGRNVFCVWWFIFVGFGGSAFGENRNADYNRLEILQTDSQPINPPQTSHTRNLGHDSRRTYRHRPTYNRNPVRGIYSDKNSTLLHGIYNPTSEAGLPTRKRTRMIYKAREDPALFYKRNNTDHQDTDNGNEYAFRSTLPHSHNHKLPQINSDNDITSNLIYMPRDDHSLFYEKNNPLDTKHRFDPKYIQRRIENSNDLAIFGSQYQKEKQLKTYRQTGRARVHSGQTVRVSPDSDQNSDKNNRYNTHNVVQNMSLSHKRSRFGKDYRAANNVHGFNDNYPNQVRREWNVGTDTVNNVTRKPCIRCPYERTLIGKIGQYKVMLLKPELITCDGDKPGSVVDIKRIYGPDFGTLLTEGSHTIIGIMTYYGDDLKLCQLRVNVVLQLCPVPNGVTVRCDAPQERAPLRHASPGKQTSPYDPKEDLTLRYESPERLTRHAMTHEADVTVWCDFVCTDADETKYLVGSSTLVCGSDLQWKGTPPQCRAKTWCSRPTDPKYGHLMCTGRALTNVALAHGSRCRARCSSGYESRPARAICRWGRWTATLACEPKT